MTPETDRHHCLARYCALLMILWLAGTSSLLQASSCQQQYKTLSTNYSDILARTQPATHAYFKALHGLENEIFVAFESCPQDTYLLTLMGELQISLGNLQLAALYAKKSHSQNQDIWQTNHLMGKSLSLLDKHDASLDYLEKAATLNSKPGLVFNLCRACLKAEEYQLAVKHCSNLIARDDHQLHASAYRIRSQAYKALKMDKKAKRDKKNARLLGY